MCSDTDILHDSDDLVAESFQRTGCRECVVDAIAMKALSMLNPRAVDDMEPDCMADCVWDEFHTFILDDDCMEACPSPFRVDDFISAAMQTMTDADKLYEVLNGTIPCLKFDHENVKSEAGRRVSFQKCNLIEVTEVPSDIVIFDLCTVNYCNVCSECVSLDDHQNGPFLGLKLEPDTLNIVDVAEDSFFGRCTNLKSTISSSNTQAQTYFDFQNFVYFY